MRYRLSLLSTQSAQSIYWDLIISVRLNFWSRVKIHGPSRATRELGITVSLDVHGLIVLDQISDRRKC